MYGEPRCFAHTHKGAAKDLSNYVSALDRMQQSYAHQQPTRSRAAISRSILVKTRENTGTTVLGSTTRDWLPRTETAQAHQISETP